MNQLNDGGRATPSDGALPAPTLEATPSESTHAASQCANCLQRFRKVPHLLRSPWLPRRSSARADLCEDCWLDLTTSGKIPWTFPPGFADQLEKVWPIPGETVR